MLNFVLAESALELVPEEIRRSPVVVSDAKRRGRDASEMLLDRSFHHSAMTRLKDSEKRGRPDLVHVALLSMTGTPLYLEGKVRVFVHTYPDMVIELQEKTRVPKNYLRFRGLVEKALVERPTEGLVRVRPEGLRELVQRDLGPDLAVGLSVQGGTESLESLARDVVAARNPCILVGGFPHGHFSGGALRLVDRLVRIDYRPLEAHVVVARVAYELEKAVGPAND